MYAGGAGAASIGRDFSFFFAGTGPGSPRARDGLDLARARGLGVLWRGDGARSRRGLVGYVRADVLARVQPERLGV